MPDASRILATILLIVVPTVEFGGLALLGMLTRRTAGYLDNPLRQNMFRPVMPTLGVAGVRSGRPAVGRPDGPTRAVEVDCPDRVVAAPILMPLGFFLSVTRPNAQRPNSVIGLVCVAGLALGVGAVTLRLGLLLSG